MAPHNPRTILFAPLRGAFFESRDCWAEPGIEDVAAAWLVYHTMRKG